MMLHFLVRHDANIDYAVSASKSLGCTVQISGKSLQALLSDRFFHYVTWVLRRIKSSQLDCLRNSLFNLTAKQMSKLRFSGPHKGPHDYVIKWKHFPRYWPFVRGIHRSPVNSPLKDQWRRALMFSLICACINGWVNNRETGNLGCHRTHYDVIVMSNAECMSM